MIKILIHLFNNVLTILYCNLVREKTSLRVCALALKTLYLKIDLVKMQIIDVLHVQF